MTGRELDAEEARAIGLVTEVVAQGRHLERALELAERLASVPQETLAVDRLAVLESLNVEIEAGLQRDVEAARSTAEVAQRGAAAFASGRDER